MINPRAGVANIRNRLAEPHKAAAWRLPCGRGAV